MIRQKTQLQMFYEEQRKIADAEQLFMEMVRDGLTRGACEMPNINALKGFRCPNCGSEGPFHIVCQVPLCIDDEGADSDFMGYSFDTTSHCLCPTCTVDGPVSYFLTEETSHDNP